MARPEQVTPPLFVLLLLELELFLLLLVCAGHKLFFIFKFITLFFSLTIILPVNYRFTAELPYPPINGTATVASLKTICS